MRISNRILITVLLGAMALSACEKGPIERAERDEVTHMASEDPAMARAFKKADESLDSFLALAANPPAHVSSMSLKVRISEGRDNEYFWITPFRVESDGFSGAVSNQPRHVRKVKQGQVIQFRREDVVDWTYIDTVKRRMHGNFTGCALLTKESPADRAAFMEKYGLACDG